MDKKVRKTIEHHMRTFETLSPQNRWKNVIESVLEKYKDTEKGRLIELRYFQGRSEVQICLELHISQRLYYDWIKDILQDAALMAAYEKLIKP